MIGVGQPAGDRPVRGRATEREHWIALSLVPGIGPTSFERLVRDHGSAAAAWRRLAEPATGRSAADATLAGLVRRRDPRDVARHVIAATRGIGGRVVTALDEAYPRALLTLAPCPPTLYVLGAEAAFGDRAVALVGTRRASTYGMAVATEMGTLLAETGVAVVSGLALGIDGAAHRAAVEAGGPTIAVLPSPLDRIYPPAHRPLARRIVESGGALVTEVPIGMVIGRPDFARRNRVIAGLAEAVVVVEAPDRSGALMTAAAAISIGRELYAVPGQIDSLGSRGPNRLIADHVADVVTSAPDLLRHIGVAERRTPPALAALSEVEGVVLTRLLERSGSLEELVDRCRLSAASVASSLALLEARGLVNPFGGATFHVTLAAKRLARAV